MLRSSVRLGTVARTLFVAAQNPGHSSKFLAAPKPREVIPFQSFHQGMQQTPINFGALGLMHDLYKDTVSNITCRRTTTADKEEIVEFLSHMFIAREPIMKALNSTIPDARPFLSHHVESALRHNASFVAVDSTGKICGIRLNAIGPASESEYSCTFSPKMNTVNKFLGHVEEGIGDRLKTHKFMRHIAICVKPEIIQCGVGTMLMQQSVKFAKAEGLKYMVATCTGKIAAKLALKMGFRVVKQVPYETYIDSESHFGYFPDDCLVNPTIRPFLSLVDKHNSAKLMVKNVV